MLPDGKPMVHRRELELPCFLGIPANATMGYSTPPLKNPHERLGVSEKGM